MAFKKWQKAWNKKAEVKAEVIEEETPVTTVEEKKITVEQIEDTIKVLKESNPDGKVIWDVGWSVIIKPKGRIKFEAQVASVPLFKLPADLKQFLMNKGWGTWVWKKDKEWFDRHGATKEDMAMIEKLKKFLTGM